ncbi:hypothetical protein B4135_2406 [Caldibacillus debilis]|uniref:Uncharacterized protein n=1 Tax=Caldibacillus debilis TaxID=301148 RepID=A0A150LZW7_9BACI|nr:hypothetical protein B4135_2406 [Caldibacillus debilis]
MILFIIHYKGSESDNQQRTGMRGRSGRQLAPRKKGKTVKDGKAHFF